MRKKTKQLSIVVNVKKGFLWQLQDATMRTVVSNYVIFILQQKKAQVMVETLTSSQKQFKQLKL